jgi:hypothetical protein
MRARNEAEADKRLLDAISKSTSRGNQKAYDAYRALPDRLRLSFLKDGSANIIDVRDEIVRELYHAAARDQVEHLVERLEGWWFSVVIKALAESVLMAIPVLAIDQRVDELREEFKRRAFPVDLKTSVPTSDVIPNSINGPSYANSERSKLGRLSSSTPFEIITERPNSGHVGRVKICY